MSTRVRPVPLRIKALGRGLLALGLLCLAGAAVAAEQPIIDAGPGWVLSVSAQVRPRVIVHSGLDLRGADSEWREHVSQRARLGLRAEAASGLSVAMELQDVRVWGEETSPNDFSAEGLDFHQANATFPLHRDLRLTLGRLELALDDERLLGRSDFTQRGHSFDGGRLVWESDTGTFAVQTLYAKITEAGTSPDGNVPEGVPGDVDFGGVHGKVEFLPGHALSPAYLVRIEQAPTHVRHDVGLHVKGEEAGLSYRVEGHYQYGKLSADTISAYMASARVGYTLDHRLAPSGTLHADLLSGDGSTASAFDTLYGSNHAYYGEMDFFTRLPMDTAGRGLVDAGATLASGLVPDLGASVAAHWLGAATAPAGADSHLGYEIDLKMTWKPVPFVTVEGFAGVFLPGDGMRGLGRAPGTGPLEADFISHLTTNVQF